MSQLTRCPNCATTFRVSDAQLALRGGRVRCGHCSFVFNAQACQVDADPVTIVDLRSDPSILEHDPFWDAPAAEEGETAQHHARAEERWPEIEPEPVAEDEPGPVPASAGRHDAWVDDLEELPPPSWLRAPSAPAQDEAQEPVPEPAAESPPPATWLSPEPAVQAAAEKPVPVAAVPEPAPRARPQNDHDWLRPAGRSPWRWLWRVGTVAMAGVSLTLLAVLARQHLIELYPASRPVLTELCGHLRCQVVAPQNLEYMQIEGVEFVFDPQNPQRLQLNALMSNFAAYSQAWPLLDVQLLDRAGQRVARRVLRPEQYLPPQLRHVKREFDAQQEVQLATSLYLDGVTVENYSVDLLPSR